MSDNAAEPEDAKPEAPADPNAPARVTLPSGRVVEVRSARTLNGADMAAALGAQSGTGMTAVVDVHNEFIRRMVTQIEPGKGGKPDLDGTLESVLAQRGDDWRRLYALVTPAYGLVTGASVIRDMDQWDDPKAPTTASSEPSSG
jgi:hypothetical protein